MASSLAAASPSAINRSVATSTAFGSWVSPITSSLLTSSSLRLGTTRAESGYVVWNEGRPQEGGRQVLVRADVASGEIIDITPAGADWNVRSTVHEYGGGEYLLGPGCESVYFSNFNDQRVYVQPVGGEPRPLTPADSPLRFADYILDGARNRLIAVVEDHTDDRPSAVKNFLGAISLDGAAADGSFPPVRELVSGADFYASPQLAPDGTTLAFVSWDHPNMPWDDTTLNVGTFDAGGMVATVRVVCGDKQPQAAMAPRFSPADGKLYFITDTNGWWNLYREDSVGSISELCPREGAEFGSAAWGLGGSPYAFLPDGRLLCTFSGPAVEGGAHLGILDPSSSPRTLTEVVVPPNSNLGDLSVSTGPDGEGVLVATVGGSSTVPAEVRAVLLPTAVSSSSGWDWAAYRASTSVEIDVGYFSTPQNMEFPTENHGLKRTAHLIFYPPTNKDYARGQDEAERPPLLVKSHGGPTGAASSAFSLAIQYWTSRGVAVADVNYGGSTGFGKAYRQRLTKPHPNWGVVDVDDCCNAALFLAEQGLVDGERMAISGGSAGGYTTLACLAFKDVFKAGASHYGIGNLEMLAADTHKFESRYIDYLVGPYPEATSTYKERSPINSVDKFSVPVALFQGLEDKVVPPNQAEEVYDQLLAKGVPTVCVLFEGEQHGFRRSANIRRALDSELQFYGSVFGFESPMPEVHSRANLCH